MKKTFPKKELLELGLPYSYDVDPERVKILEDTIYDTSRWSELHELTFELDGVAYQTGYSVGLTELQDERPWEYETDVVCTEVELKAVTVEKWVPVENKS